MAHGGEPLGPGDLGGGVGKPGAPVDAVPIYGINETQLRDDPSAALRDARPIGWRTVCADPEDETLGVALVDSYAAEGRADQVRVIRGPTVSRFAAAGTLAEDELEGGGAEFEPRILDFGTLGLTALWMHSPAVDDCFYPLGDQHAKQRNSEFVLDEAVRRAELQPRASETGGGGDEPLAQITDPSDDRGG